MTAPSLLLGLVISLLYGAIFHLLRGGSLGRLILYLLLGFIGFWTGQLVAEYSSWTVFSIGPLHIGLASIFSWVFILGGYWLSLIPNRTDLSKKNSSKRKR